MGRKAGASPEVSEDCMASIIVVPQRIDGPVHFSVLVNRQSDWKQPCYLASDVSADHTVAQFSLLNFFLALLQAYTNL